MRFSLDGDYWVLDEIDDVHWFMLMQLPQAADYNQSDKGRKRILPDPADAKDIVADWKEFIQPELETQFKEELETIATDLSKAEEDEADDGKVFRFVSVPVDHAEVWYNVLNRARLVLNEEHDIFATEQQIYQGEKNPSEIGEERWLVFVQYRVYAVIQEFLLSYIMEPGLEDDD